MCLLFLIFASLENTWQEIDRWYVLFHKSRTYLLQHFWLWFTQCQEAEQIWKIIPVHFRMCHSLTHSCEWALLYQAKVSNKCFDSEHLTLLFFLILITKILFFDAVCISTHKNFPFFSWGGKWGVKKRGLSLCRPFWHLELCRIRYSNVLRSPRTFI